MVQCATLKGRKGCASDRKEEAIPVLTHLDEETQLGLHARRKRSKQETKKRTTGAKYLAKVLHLIHSEPVNSRPTVPVILDLMVQVRNDICQVIAASKQNEMATVADREIENGKATSTRTLAASSSSSSSWPWCLPASTSGTT